MSAYTESWLTMYEMELAGIFKPVVREDFSEDWEPCEDIDPEEFNQLVFEYFKGKWLLECLDDDGHLME